MRWTAAALTIGIAATLACANGGGPPPGDEPGAPPPGAEEPGDETLTVQPIEEATAASSGIRDRRRLVIRTDSEWEAFWSDLLSNRMPTPPAPEIDFDRFVVIAATMGQRPTGGHAIGIADVEHVGGEYRVTVVETSPGPGCVTTQALTAPATAVRVERREGGATFLERSETRTC